MGDPFNLVSPLLFAGILANYWHCRTRGGESLYPQLAPGAKGLTSVISRGLIIALVVVGPLSALFGVPTPGLSMAIFLGSLATVQILAIVCRNSGRHPPQRGTGA